MKSRQPDCPVPKLVESIVSYALQKKAEHIVGLRVGPFNGIADWFIICEGDNKIHNGAIAYGIIEGLEAEGISVWRSEGIEDGRWVLLDFSDVMVHIMLPHLREYYGLEQLWAQAEKIDFSDNTST